MSYASVAANNAPPPSLQPHADPGLLNTASPSGGAPHDSHKANVVHPSYRSSAGDFDPLEDATQSHRKRKERLHEAEQEGLELWETTKDYLLRPSVAGGLVGVVNLGLLAGAGRAFYLHPAYRSDPIVLSSTVAATVFILSAEGYVAAKFHETPEGQEAERRAREEGSILFRHLHETILRPGYVGGLVGLVNVGVLGVVGYRGYQYWDTPSWDTGSATQVAAGLCALFAAEAFMAERYSKTPEGKAARRRAKEEGSALYKHMNEAVCRPGVLGGIVGFVNAGILATVGYYGYIHWDEPSWDTGTVSAISLGLVALWAGEGLVAERYRENQEHYRK